jgi:hypothetical protein
VAIVETNGVAEHRQFPVEALELGRALRKRIEEFNKKCTTRDLELAFPSFLSRYGIDIKNSELAELVAACMNDEETTEGKLLKSLNGDAHPLLAAVEGKKIVRTIERSCRRRRRGYSGQALGSIGREQGDDAVVAPHATGTASACYAIFIGERESQGPRCVR